MEPTHIEIYGYTFSENCRTAVQELSNLDPQALTYVKEMLSSDSWAEYGGLRAALEAIPGLVDTFQSDPQRAGRLANEDQLAAWASYLWSDLGTGAITLANTLTTLQDDDLDCLTQLSTEMAWDSTVKTLAAS
ncbi:hypothetical protein ABZW32_19180 [Streptomyces sp. NPDC004667]|uniref:hypothetical protein n=1 Tax=Streptomyces sp. NPDC004667 TaxID=3154285 RepID=UPI0033A4EA2C